MTTSSVHYRWGSQMLSRGLVIHPHSTKLVKVKCTCAWLPSGLLKVTYHCSCYRHHRHCYIIIINYSCGYEAKSLFLSLSLSLTFYLKWQLPLIHSDIDHTVQLLATSEAIIFDMNVLWNWMQTITLLSTVYTIANGYVIPVKKISVSPAATKILPKPMMLSSTVSGLSGAPATITLTRPSGTSNQCQVTSVKVTAGSLMQGNAGKPPLTL